MTRLPVLLALLLLLLWSCGGDSLKGRVVLSGSATLAPLVERQSAAWSRQHPDVEVRIEAIGSDAGLERLLQFDEADLALVSRPLSTGERAKVTEAGGELIALPLAWDAVSLVVPASNTWVKSLTTEQTVQAFTTTTVWSDLDPSWPSTALHRFVLGPRSGTGDVFASALLGGDKQRLYQAALVQSSEDDRILARGIAEIPGSVGFLGWATVRESASGLRVLALEGVEPTEATISTRTYPLVRELSLVTTRQRWDTRLEVVSLVRHLYDGYPSLLKGTGLVPIDAVSLEAVQTLLND